jgi:hypothetical protein
VVQIRPEAQQKLNAGFQRRVDQQAYRYGPQLAYAEELAVRFECGQVAGVFTAKAGGGVPRRAYVVGLLPLAAIPILIAAAAVRIPGVLPLLLLFPFLEGAWFGISMFRGREPKRDVWFYAFTEGFLLPEDPRAAAGPVRWSDVTELSEVWTDVYNVSAEQTRPMLTDWRLGLADGQSWEISRTFQNVRDPYKEVGQMLRGLMPERAGQVLPTFPTVDQIVTTYAGRPGGGPGTLV